MKLKRLEIHNYKSLRNVVLKPGPLSVFVGPNASGKSNLADALDFLSEVYRWDLEGAIKKKGGYENISFRQAKPLPQAIRFRVVLEMEWDPLRGLHLVFDHRFETVGRWDSFELALEDLTISTLDRSGCELIVRLIRSGEEPTIEIPQFGREFIEQQGWAADPEDLASGMRYFVDKSELFLSLFRPGIPVVNTFSESVAALRVFQLSPRLCREAGVPTPKADLDRYGRNLPAVIDYLKNKAPWGFDQLLQAARKILPSLESIETDFTYTKTLGLFLKETGVKKPWTAEEISDGTIQAIALLTATFDPRIPILVIEEPENSVHPWAIRNFVEAFRVASEQKQIFLTTHSPVLIDQIRPEELWVVRRPKLETEITPALELDPSLEQSWGQGKFTLSEYLDSGALPEAVPAAGV